MGTLDLSIIVPLFNEEENVQALYEAIREVAETLDRSYEIVFVDDGSKDATFALAAELASKDPNLRVIEFRKNYGQTPAMVAGIDHARGTILVTMDGDLQNDPADIPEFLAKIEEGYDIVAGWRRRRQDKALSRVLPSKVANWLIAKVTGVAIKDNGCSLKAYRAALIKRIPLYSEMHRFIPAMMSVAGARIAQIPVRHHPRRFGVSKYGISRVYKVLFDLLTIKTILVLATRPLFSFTGAAVLFGLSSALLFGYELMHPVFGQEGFSLMNLSIGMLLGALAIFLVSLGLLAQLVYRTGSLRIADLSVLTASLARDEARGGPKC